MTDRRARGGRPHHRDAVSAWFRAGRAPCVALSAGDAAE